MAAVSYGVNHGWTGHTMALSSITPNAWGMKQKGEELTGFRGLTFLCMASIPLPLSGGLWAPVTRTAAPVGATRGVMVNTSASLASHRC